MNKTAIKNFAIWARNKLIADIQYRAGLMGITANGIKDPLPQSTGTMEFYDIGTSEPYAISGEAISQRKKLVEIIRKKEKDSNYATAYKYILEEVAYTWFNRMIAIRFMEVNDYLPSHIRVLSSESGKIEPDLVTTPFDAELAYTSAEEETVLRLKTENKLDELFRLLFIKQCNALNELLPALFETTNDYTELLLNLSVVDQEGVVYHLIHDIDEDDFNIEKGGQVEIIGWLYQYYNTEPKNAAFAKNGKITKEEIPAVTQLFTPDWIVRYMVENSLGRIFISGQLAVASGQWAVGSGQWPVASDQRSVASEQWSEAERIEKEKALAEKMGWRYYLPEAEQTPEVRAQLNKLTTGHSSLTTLKIIDPCMGSGHILVYAFDVLMQMYENDGYSQRDAAQCILENNLFGLDIDERAAQLAYFAVMMKARQYDRRIFSRGIQPHVYAIAESNGIDAFTRDYFANNDPKLKAALDSIMNDLRDAKEYGSILTVAPVDFAALYARMDEVQNDISLYRESALNAILPLIRVAEVLAQQYDVVVTNPPYAGRRNLNARICCFLDKRYPDGKMDLFSAFIVRNTDMTKRGGFTGFMTPFVWLYLSSYTQLRDYVLSMSSLTSCLQPEETSFKDAAVSLCSFVTRKICCHYRGRYVRFNDITDMDEQASALQKIAAGETRKYTYIVDQNVFSEYPDSRIIFWETEAFQKTFASPKKLGEVCQPRQGMATTNNELFLRLWHEPSIKEIGFGYHNEDEAEESGLKWFPYNKGGGFRKWYGKNEYIVNYEHRGKTICDYIDNTSGARVGSNGRVINRQFFFNKSITWSDICGNNFAARSCPNGFIFDVKGSSAFVSNYLYEYILAFLNSKVNVTLLNGLNPSVTTQVGDLKQLPFIMNESKVISIQKKVTREVELSKFDWDAYETSWDFQRHPLLCPVAHLADAYTTRKAECEKRFLQLKSNEEELNRIFIDIYGLQDELTPDVADKDVTVHRIFDTKDDVPESMQGSNYVRTKRDEIVSLLSYAVGCMLGRYSLDVDGLAYAGGRFSDQWVVVSGQLINRKVVEECVSQELSRAFGMAEVDVAGRGDIPASETAAERGAICLIRPDAAGSGVGSIQYRRGTSKKLYEGICELPLHFPGVSGGTGNPVYDLCSPEILDALTNRNGAELVRRGWKDAERFDWEAVHWSLTTDHFSPDRDGILPITDEEYLEDDIISRLCDWLKAAYGADTLEENLDFIAEALGGKGGSSREIIRSYFFKDFFKDHCKTYQKRPIYWLFDSGKQNGFKALIYLHRYTPDTIGNLRVDYLHKMQRVYESEINRMQDMIDHSTNVREVAASTKRKEKLQKQLKECRDYDEMIAHLALSRIELDLDDGVKVNYEKIQTASDGKKYAVLAKI